MSSGLSLRLEQSHRLIMTPELRQAIELLQLTTAELRDYLFAQALENPMLEIREGKWERPVGFSLDRLKDSSQWKDERANSPRQDLFLDIECSTAKTKVKLAARALVDSLDDRGYLPRLDETLCASLGYARETLQEGRDLLVSLGPPGIGATCVEECLLLQLENRGKLSPLAKQIIEQSLPHLGDGADILADRLQASLEEVSAVLGAIKECHPYPARYLLQGTPLGVIFPDVHIIRQGNELLPIVTEESHKFVGLSQHYHDLLKGEADDQCRAYLRDQYRRATWLLRALEQRRDTLQKVIQVLVVFQQPFLLMGREHLRPLTLMQVAQEIGVHESTVSRAVAHKYALTPQGLLPLKFFFDSGVRGIAGGVAAEAVKGRMLRIISQEDQTHPISDQQISHLLRREGISISRRTVAKYRADLGVLASSERRRYVIMG